MTPAAGLFYNWAMSDHRAEGDMPAPGWPTCGHAEGDDHCIGRRVDGFDHCLAHLEPDQLDRALHRLRPGADLNASGTPINGELLEKVLHAVRDQDGRSRFGSVSFTQAQFTEDAGFTGAEFSGDASFDEAQFNGNAGFDRARFAGSVTFASAQFTKGGRFESAQFKGDTRFNDARFAEDAWFLVAQFTGSASFDSAQFTGNAIFGSAQFRRDASFNGVQFTGEAQFSRAQLNESARFAGAKFIGDAEFGNAQFTGDTRFTSARFTSASFTDVQFNGDTRFDDAQFTEETWFDSAHFTEEGWFNRVQFKGDTGFTGAKFTGDAWFDSARFDKATMLGPLSALMLSLKGTEFVFPVVIDAAAANVSCRDATWYAGVTLRLRFATVDLERATFTAPSFVSGADRPFELRYPTSLEEEHVRSRALDDRGMSPDLWIPLLTSLRGSDAANLTITDVDLTPCRFAGARLLDELRLEGRCIFGRPPPGLRIGWAWPPVWRWSRRQSLAEERSWRATTRKYAGWADERSSDAAEVRLERLAGLYRQLRKAQEDAKNEPGAADFYYGEMEMRRKATTTPPGERAILWLYWLISGYGLRALRAVAALGILAVIVTTALTGWGLAASAPASTPPQHLAGTITSGAGNGIRINATLNPATPRLPPARQRWTAPRARTALEVTLDSVVFRTTDQPLTTAGTWTTDAARILGPVLLALALLAIRNRVRR
jgi:hypothetical protein